MTKKQFEQEMQYQALVTLIQRMLDEGIISRKEYQKIETNLYEKYHPLFRSEYRNMTC